MRITVIVDDVLYDKALELAEPGMDEADIFREALTTYVRVQAGKRLAALGGSSIQALDVVARRKPDF